MGVPGGSLVWEVGVVVVVLGGGVGWGTWERGCGGVAELV